jgi:hypothetical protein
MSDELSRSLSSIWQRKAGARPSSARVEFAGDVIKFVMEEPIATDPEPADGEDGEDGAAEARTLDSLGYRNEAVRAVGKITGRRVRGFITKHDEKTDVSTDTFILEPVHVAR